jgi:hypothetical protein
MNDITNRLLEVCKVKKVKQVDLINEGAGSRPTVSAAFTGKQKPNLDIIEALLKVVPELNARWLFTGKGQMFNELPYSDSSEQLQKSEEGCLDDYGDDVKNYRQIFNKILDEFIELRKENYELKKNMNLSK